MAEQFLIRDAYNPRVVNRLAKDIKKVYKDFEDKGFSKAINSRLKDLSLTERGNLITENLIQFLPDDFPKAVKILLSAIGPEHRLNAGETDWDGFIYLPQTVFIARQGLEHFDISMNALIELTKRFSSEFAIRTFIERYPKKTLAILKKLTKDKNVHVRRLVSEGTRPRLPWANPLKGFMRDPSPVLKLLELLKDDKEIYVRRSVANNLNDISKDNPEVVITTLKIWQKDSSKEMKWLISHALRTLVKKGDKYALRLLGYSKADVKLKRLTLKKDKILQGNDLNFELELISNKKQSLMIDYAIHFVKASGKHKDKVFKLSKKKMKKGQSLNLSKKHSFKSMTTRKHYKGDHILELIINGDRFDKKRFYLDMD